ncbi:hypothetical protein EPUS_03089 [Endocarpon pusillum Z07020]|uniref:Uncharacterized protein n=1 Tax=Endocarpon pusillum (strain Z07020 / HMAS-L-300199) TaxID=1263415 RepID=U1G778_ENDPU|nr:uncharacterized protein EPUS_03089 [Endocarpon pusillum Z07020]ERF73257.1 hypothetical protein EPUS_03089 [Endocarpon pusillum Z07020]
MQIKLRAEPKIWCLTGLIELNDVTVLTVTKTNPSASAGVSSELGSMMGLPVSCSFNFDKNYAVTCSSKTPGKMVWAAQYQLVKVKPVVKDSTPGSQTAINYLDMYPDYTYSEGRRGLFQAMNDKRDHKMDDKEEGFELELADVANQKGGKVERAVDEKYWKVYYAVEEKMKSALQANERQRQVQRSQSAVRNQNRCTTVTTQSRVTVQRN